MMQAQELSIREVAARVGLTGHTLRYYERIGLMDAIARDAIGHRRYTERDLEWITLLHRLRLTGMPIAEVQRFAALVRRGEATIGERRALLQAYRHHLQERAAQIAQTIGMLDGKIAHYSDWEADPARRSAILGDVQERDELAPDGGATKGGA